jgi:hypothetical protein
MISKNNLMNWGKLFLVIFFIILSILNFIRIDSVSHSASDTLRPFIIQTAILMLLFLPIYYWLTKNKALIKKK